MNIVKRASGLTLIELMVVVAIVAILTAIAYPSYQDYVRKGRRADAKASLLRLSLVMERNYSETGRYDRDGSGNTVDNDWLPFVTSPQPSPPRPVPGDFTYYYDLAVTAQSNQYTLTASPRDGQQSDACGVLTLTSIGDRLPGECW